MYATSSNARRYQSEAIYQCGDMKKRAGEIERFWRSGMGREVFGAWRSCKANEFRRFM